MTPKRTVNLCGYKSEIPPERVKAYQAMEDARQALRRGEVSQRSLNYAKYLSAIENDATCRHGEFRKAIPDLDDVMRQWPFLKPLIDADQRQQPTTRRNPAPRQGAHPTKKQRNRPHIAWYFAVGAFFALVGGAFAYVLMKMLANLAAFNNATSAFICGAC
jgi:hypothetical protein